MPRDFGDWLTEVYDLVEARTGAEADDVDYLLDEYDSEREARAFDAGRTAQEHADELSARIEAR